MEVETIATTGVFLPDMFEIEGTVYVGIPNFRDSSGFTAAAEVWERSDSFGKSLHPSSLTLRTYMNTRIHEYMNT